MAVYVQGQVVTVYTNPPFTTTPVGGGAGILVDPGVVTFVYRVNAGPQVIATYTQGSGDPSGVIIRDSVGAYHANVPTRPAYGDYEYGFDSTLSGIAAAVGRFTVRANPLLV